MCPISPLDFGPSENLSWEELGCKDGTEYPFKWRSNRAITLAGLFEDIRAIWNRPIVIVSAYRSPKHNKSIGGARYSQHMEGRALDLHPPKRVKLVDFYSEIKKNANTLGIKGLGLYPTFVHVDFRPSRNLVTWSGVGVKDS